MLLISNVLWAYAMVMTKIFKDYTPSQINFHFGCTVTLVSSLAYCSMGSDTNFTFEKLLKVFFLTAVPTALTNHLHITALKTVNSTGLLMIVSFSMVIMGYMMSIFFYNESQNPICTMGAVMIVGGVSKAIYGKMG